MGALIWVCAAAAAAGLVLLVLPEVNVGSWGFGREQWCREVGRGEVWVDVGVERGFNMRIWGEGFLDLKILAFICSV